MEFKVVKFLSSTIDTGCARKKDQYSGKVIVSVIVSKKLCMYICPIPNGFRDTSYFTVQFQNC
jgi:hypothetical protein